MTRPRQRLLLSSSSTVHVDGCPTMSHVVDGRAARSAWRTEHTMRPLAYPEVRLGPDEYLEPPYAVQWREYRVDYIVPMITTLEELAARTAKYSRCAVCAPDVPPFAPVVPAWMVRAGNIDSKDLGRCSVDYGRVVSVHHRTALRFEDGTEIEVDSEDRIAFYARSFVPEDER